MLSEFGTITASSAVGSERRRTNASAATEPISDGREFTEVNEGRRKRDAAMSSKPMTLTSPPTVRPLSWIAAQMPVATMSL
jgi:hypothetical protein